MNLDQKNESDLRPTKSPHPNREMVALWSFVVVSFAALFIAGYFIWAKCHGK
ncbi:MAG TPA: hypothetical protein VNN22_05590 [Verrucomicrobiae bacterium]|nr:hypothetical protein [Verrucomicrobiae bacterium]